jgi:hypothetical protein
MKFSKIPNYFIVSITNTCVAPHTSAGGLVRDKAYCLGHECLPVTINSAKFSALFWHLGYDVL